jgi:hypothetical protein
MTVNEALQILKAYSGIQIKIPASAEEKSQLREALISITDLCESEILGICADSLDQGYQSLKSYLQGMGYQNPQTNPGPLDTGGAVYLKYNIQKDSFYIDAYTGSYRGVLVACQSDNEELQGTYGHFPLDLFC